MVPLSTQDQEIIAKNLGANFNTIMMVFQAIGAKKSLPPEEYRQLKLTSLNCAAMAIQQIAEMLLSVVDKSGLIKPN